LRKPKDAADGSSSFPATPIWSTLPPFSPFWAAGQFMTEAFMLSVPHRDYFISRSSADAAFACWIGKLIVVALYSQSYFDSKYCVREATEALKGDPANEQ
jgi:hypothetical protein